MAVPEGFHGVHVLGGTGGAVSVFSRLGGWRHAGGWITIALQLLILITGNYTFFNLLPWAACLALHRAGTGGRRRKPACCGAAVIGVTSGLLCLELVQRPAAARRRRLCFVCGAPAHREFVRPVRGDDYRAAGDRAWKVRTTASTGRPTNSRTSRAISPRTADCGAGPAATGLADVVRGSRNLPAKPLVREFHVRLLQGEPAC